MIGIIKLKKGRMTDVTEADTNGQKHSESKAGYNIQDDVFQIGKRGHTAELFINYVNQCSFFNITFSSSSCALRF